MSILTILPMNEVEELQNYNEMKFAIEDLCKMLAINNELFIENDSIIYSRLINDNLEYLKKIEEFWRKYRKMYSVNLNQDEELYVDYITRELGIRKIGSC